MDVVRVGFVSSVNQEAGTARIYYPDRGATTAELPVFAGWGEAAFPSPGDQVVVLHLSNDTSSGVILGLFWSQEDVPPGDTEYWKRLGADGYLKSQKGQLVLHGKSLAFEDEGGSMALEEILQLKERVEALERRGE